MGYYIQTYLVSKKKLSLTLLGLVLLLAGISQCPTNIQFEKKTNAILNDSSLNENKKLHFLYDLKRKAEGCNISKDSIYAMLLYKIGLYEYNLNKDYIKSIDLTLESIRINSQPGTNRSRIGTIKCYLNLSYYYRDILQYNRSLSCCDSAISIAENYPGRSNNAVEAKLIKTYNFFLSGDYQKCVEEGTKGIVYALTLKDTFHYVEFLIQRSQSLFFQNKLDESVQDIESIFKNTSNIYNIASALKTKALVYARRKSFALAKTYFIRAVSLRSKLNDYEQITNDYIDLGNFYLLSLHNIPAAKKSYFKAIEYARKANNFAKLASIYTNLGNLYLTTNEYAKASEYYLQTFRVLKVFTVGNIVDNPPAILLNTIGSTELITELLSKKVLLFLQLFKHTNEKKFIIASIKTALVTDSVITQKRHQQLGEQSKLYWRDQTRGFFTGAIEACFLANDAVHAFYFMEKSRSVLLNDKLNELGASAHIPAGDAKKEQDLKIKLLAEQQKLDELTVNTAAYNTQREMFLAVKQNFEDFTKSLEVRYPAYYIYKYSDKVPSLSDLQKELQLKDASFVHYFTNDTVAYILSITANTAKISRLSKNIFNYEQINQFLKFCSDKDLLNTKANYKSFASLSNGLYKTLFEPLQIHKGRVIICSDNFLMPFEALYSDADGKNFLLKDYIFSYAYSATSLLKKFTAYRAKGNFIGFAPVNFQHGLHLNPLINSASALSQSAGNYNSSLLFTYKAATKHNFIKNIGNYTVVNIFSHASADSSKNEPALYMQDATINLSELQLLNKPATSLVVLSACQTNVGKNVTGEGIYSLARGFASAGIPSVSATLWKADEDMIYKVSAKFNQYLAEGFSKDIALHKAKLDYLKENTSGEKLMPYYWANIILIGNTAPLELTSSLNRWWIAAGICLVLFVVAGMLVRWKRRSLATSHSVHSASKNEMKYGYLS